MPDQKLKTEQPKGADIYDVSGSTPTLGEVPHEQVQEAVLSGRFHLPTNKPVPVLSPDGELGEIPAEQAAAAFQQGYKYATPDQVKYSEKPVTAAVLGAADAATFGLAGAVLDPIAEAMGAPKNERLKIKEQNEGAYTAGQLGALVAPGGVGSALNKIGEAGAAAVGLAAPTTALGRVGSMTTKAAIENMVFASGDELAKKFMGDPQASVETALINVGLAGVLGGGIGGAVGAVPELWRIGPGKALNSMLNSVKLASEGVPTADLAKLEISAAPEIQAALSDSPLAQKSFQALMQSDTMAGEATQKAFQQFQMGIDDATTRTLGRTVDEVAELSAAKTGEALKQSINDTILKTYEPLAQSYERLEAKFGTAQLMPELRDSMGSKIQQLIVDDGLLKSKAAEPLLKIAQETLEDLPRQANAQDLRLLAQNLRDAHPFGKDTYQIAKKLNSIINEGMDATLAQSAELAGAGAEFKATQAGYRQFRGLLEDLNDYVHAGKVRGAESYIKAIRDMDPEVLARRLSQERTQLRATLEQSFPDVAAKINQYNYDRLLEKSVKDGQFDIKKLVKQIAKLEPETKAAMFKPEQLEKIDSIAKLVDKIPKNMNPSGTAKTMSALLGMPAATMAGALLGGASGGIGGLLLAAGAKEGQAGARLAMLRFLASDAPTNAAALKQAMGMASAVEKGERLLTRATKDVFEAKNGTAVKAPDVSKLKELVDDVVQDESKLLNVGADLGHYLPDQAAALGAATVRNVRYLASLRPSTAPLSPLDGPRKVAQNEESDYNRALAIAQQPLIVLDAVKQGRVTMKDMQHIHQLYPSLVPQMQAKLQQEMMEALANGKDIPYATQIGLSAFMGMPLSTSLQPRAIRAAQPVQVSMPPQQGKPMRKSPGMSKLPSASLTPGQSRARDRVQ